MKQSYIFAALLVGASAMTGCVDDNYDLSNIDKTTEVKVDNLTLPINLDIITLNDIIDVDDDSQIKRIELNGKEVYAVTETGNFKADKITINGVTATAPNIAPIVSVLRLLNQAPAYAPTRAGETEITAKYNLKSSPVQEVNISANSIDEALVSLDNVACQPMQIKINLAANGVGNTTTMKFNKITLSFLKGLTLQSVPSNYSYNPSTGLLTITNLQCPNNATEIVLTATGVDLKTAGSKIENHNLNYNSDIQMKEAELETVTKLQQGMTVSEEIQFTISTKVDDLVVKSFTGQIQYALEGNDLNIDPVNLNDLPEFLNDDQTNILLADPQIYLGITNPVANYKLSFQTGLELTAVRSAGETKYGLDNDGKIVIGYNLGVNDPYNFVLAPAMPADPLAGYTSGLKLVQFTGLSKVLSGNGLPTQIKIDLVKPELPTQTVTNFALPAELPALEGSYDFLAPLALDPSSKIIYTKTEDGWGDKDLAKLTINTLEISADVTSTIPLSATLTVVPLYKNNFDDESEVAKPIQGVKGEATLPANCTNHAMTVSVKGDIKNLDGVKITAIAEPGSNEALGPNQTIVLKNVRATVSGAYITDFSSDND